MPSYPPPVNHGIFVRIPLSPPPHDYSDMVGKGYGSIGSRCCRVTNDSAFLAHVAPDWEWRDLASWVRVESECRSGDRVATDAHIFILACPRRPNLCCWW